MGLHQSGAARLLPADVHLLLPRVWTPVSRVESKALVTRARHLLSTLFARLRDPSFQRTTRPETPGRIRYQSRTETILRLAPLRGRARIRRSETCRSPTLIRSPIRQENE